MEEIVIWGPIEWHAICICMYVYMMKKSIDRQWDFEFELFYKGDYLTMKDF